MLIKAGVDISRLQPPIRKRLGCVSGVFLSVGEEMVITSTYEGNHGAGSLHYANLGVDFGYPSKMNDDFMARFRDCFSSDYDVVAEQDHIHVEFDPK